MQGGRAALQLLLQSITATTSQLPLSWLGQLQREHSRPCQRRATGSVQPVQRFPLACHLQRSQDFEMIIMPRQSRSLIKFTQVNAHRLKALTFLLSEIQLLPVEHQQAQADERGITQTAYQVVNTLLLLRVKRRRDNVICICWSTAGGRNLCNTHGVSSSRCSCCGRIAAI